MQTNSTGDITTCTFISNTALNGGGVYQNMASGSILRSAFTNNIAGQKGGAIFGETSSGNIMNSTFTTNRASQAGGAGEYGVETHLGILCPVALLVYIYYIYSQLLSSFQWKEFSAPTDHIACCRMQCSSTTVPAACPSQSLLRTMQATEVEELSTGALLAHSCRNKSGATSHVLHISGRSMT